MEFAQDRKNSGMNGKVTCGDDLSRRDLINKNSDNDEVNKMTCEFSKLDGGELIMEQTQKGAKTQGKHLRKRWNIRGLGKKRVGSSV
jgi:hypothetical protein